MKMRCLLLSFLTASILAAAPAVAGPRDDILAGYATAAKAADPSFAGFSAARGQAFYLAEHPESTMENVTSCTSCHTKDPTNAGKRLPDGKALKPMAVSQTPDRFTEPEQVEKWFTRNCKGIIGRECTPVEKGDFITFLASK